MNSQTPFSKGILLNIFAFPRVTVSDVNLALRQPTYMSSESDSSDCKPRCVSERAVDGERWVTKDKCSLTYKENDPWFAVRLAHNDSVAKVVVTNRNFNGERVLTIVLAIVVNDHLHEVADLTGNSGRRILDCRRYHFTGQTFQLCFCVVGKGDIFLYCDRWRGMSCLMSWKVVSDVMEGRV